MEALSAPLPGQTSAGDPLAAVERLADTFGAAAVAGLLHGLRDMLVRACTGEDETARAGEAHRIAGLAGTLGFAELGRHWLPIADGTRAIAPDTHHACEQAIATINAAEKSIFTDC